MSLNRIIIMGRMVRDPELRTTPNGVPVTSFTLAVDLDMKDKQTGERATDFIDVVAWRHIAEFVCKHFPKGSMICLEGRLQIRDWKDKEGNNRRNAEVHAENIYFAGAKRDGESRSNAGSYSEPAGYGVPEPSGFAEIEDDGNLPF